MSIIEERREDREKCNDKGFFFALTPDRVLDAVEASGLLCTGRCLTLNSFENRVYDVEIETEEDLDPKNPSSKRRIVKFYRPGRWTMNQILEEHQFLQDLCDAEIPAIAPLPFPDGKTLQKTKESEIWYSIFPKVGGRAPDELSDEQLIRIGRLLGRIHNVGASKQAKERLRINPSTYGNTNLEFLLKGKWLPLDFESRYRTVVEKICKIAEPKFQSLHAQRIHGDCHLGNLLWNNSGPFFLDFDDMVIGPEIQDIWLIVPGRDSDAVRQRETLLEGYREFRRFDTATLKLIEVFRALRYIHYTAWLAKRWEDPAFPLAFPQFGTHQYWNTQVEDLEEQLERIANV